MNNSETPIELLFEKAETYGKTTIELVKLKAVDKTADIGSSLAVQIVLAVIAALFSLSITVGIALWLGNCLGKPFYGFFIVAGFYLLVGFVVYSFKIQWIKLPIQNSIIKQILQQKNNEKK